MTSSPAIDALKEALLMEYRGKALYESARNSAADPEVRDLFQELADEEQLHINTLGDRFKALHRPGPTPGFPTHARKTVLTRSLAKAIAGAGYEAAVISAAIELEKAAIAFYDRAAGQAGEDEQRKLFAWLADWEKGHLGLLADLDRELKEKVWFDHQFWPLD
ncbi:MAG TPA: ferritin family protein [Candidatus Aminicenantes bacterium]|nr:ferritin family protein [Candidatus Aminicenantes bacterium]